MTAGIVRRSSCNSAALLLDAADKLSSNPCRLDKHDIFFKVPISRPSDLATLAIKMAVTAEVGIIKYPADRDGTLMDKGSKFVVIKDADIGLANLGSGISIGVGSRTTQNTSCTCKVHNQH